MRTIISLFIIFLCAVNANSQELYPKKKLSVKSLFLSLDEEHPEMAKFINDNEGQYVLDFNSDLTLRFPDSVQNPQKIKFVSISFSSNANLVRQIFALKKFPNLEYLEIKTAVQFRPSDIKKNLSLPENLKTLHKLKYLQISGSYHIEYSTFFETLQGISHLEYLGLPHIWEDLQLPDSFLKLSNLKGIKIEGFKEFHFPANMSSLKNLHSIVMVPEQYKNLSGEFKKFASLPHLHQLTFYYGKFKDQDLLYFEKFRELKSLSFTNNEFGDIQNLIDNLPKNNGLENLSLLNLKTKGEITDYSKLKNLKSLQIQSYSGKEFKINEGFFNLKKLEYLDLSSDSLTTINNHIGELTELRVLKLSFNHLKELPKSIGNLRNLDTLFLNQNHLKVLPESFGNLKKLKELQLQSNDLKMLPTNFPHLKNLITLHLSNNRLTNLPLDFSNLINLKILNLSVNNLTQLPEGIGNFQDLKGLYAQNNYLNKLPVSIVDLKNLENLDLSYNNLTFLPSNFGKLTKLKELLLGGNNNGEPLRTYRINEGYHQDTTRTDVTFNHIKYLPQSFSNLPNLKRIYLSEIPTLDENNLFVVLFNLKSRKYTIEISECGIQNLPKTGWKNFLGSKLNMSGNILNGIPKDIVNAPYLSEMTFKLNNIDKLSYGLKGKNQLLAFYEEKGFIDFMSLPKTPEMAKAYLSNAYNSKYTQGRNSLELMKKAFKLDSSYTASHISADNYADALLENKDYKKSIKYYTKAIEKDTARGPYILNFILPHFQNRASASLAIGDTLAAINDFYIISKRFSSGDWGRAALLARKIGKDSLAEEYFKKGEEFYKNEINARQKNNRADYGYQLSLLELFIVEEDFKKAQLYYEQLKKENISAKDKDKLLTYFGFILNILNNKFEEAKWKNFTRELDGIKIESWSFDFFNMWTKFSTLPETQKQKIVKVTQTMMEH